MYDDVIDLWAWHCICNGIATPGLAGASALTTGHCVANHSNNIHRIDDLSHKEFVVSHSYYLRRHSQYKNVYISTDMTKLQREKHRKLVQ